MFKFLIIYSASLFFFRITFGQTQDTIRVYKFEDNWKLIITNPNTFSLMTDASDKEVKMIDGFCSNKDSLLQFVCDTSIFKFKFLLSDDFKNSNISKIVTGKFFIKKNNIVIPQDTFVSTNIYSRYSRGNGFGGWTIQIRKNKTYRFTQYTCMSHEFEEGTWTIKNNYITLIPDNKKWTMLNWVTSNGKFYVADNFLIGLKTAKAENANQPTSVTETYCYLSKEN